MSLDPQSVAATTQFFCDWQLLTPNERRQILWLVGEPFAFTDALCAADSMHVHVKLDDVADLPRERIRTLGADPENEAAGYVKYRFLGGINAIFSSIPIATDDLIPGAAGRPKPFMDHAGIDIRHDEPSNRAVFDAIPDRAVALGWRSVTQEGPINCCHTPVAAKHWVYPPACLTSWRRPIEIAFGALKIFDTTVGCDVRPIDPAHPLAGSSTSCCAGSAAPQPGNVGIQR